MDLTLSDVQMREYLSALAWQEYTAARREVERLREALAAIAEDRVPHPDGYYVRVTQTLSGFAQAALGGESS